MISFNIIIYSPVQFYIRYYKLSIGILYLNIEIIKYIINQIENLQHIIKIIILMLIKIIKQ